MKRRAQALILCGATLMIAGPRSQPQEKSPSQKISDARSFYYTPTAQGLKSFQCLVSLDWGDLLSHFSRLRSKDRKALLSYLNSVRLSVSDNLDGQGQLAWVETSDHPAPHDDVADNFRRGMQGTLSGFFSSWNSFMNGRIIPPLGPEATVTQDGDRLRLHTRVDGVDVDEFFDSQLLLTRLDLVGSGTDETTFPVYVETPDGALVSALRTTVRESTTAPAGELTLHINYAMVSNFRLPHTLVYDLSNVGTFVFKFSDCTVQTSANSGKRQLAESAPGKP